MPIVEEVLKIEGSRVLGEILESENSIIFSEGGTSSTKTYSFLQALIIKSFNETGKLTRIARKTWPALRDSVLKDFFDILIENDLYDADAYSKVDKEYKLNGNVIKFISLDDPKKKRGPRADRTWLNEANEFDYEDFFQLSARTREELWLDYNPSDEYHWIYDEIEREAENATFIQSTFLDNPWLEEFIIRRIKKLKETDETYWKIYGLGERAVTKAKIYNNWTIIDAMPQGLINDCYGLDFGYNNPSALIHVAFDDDGNVYIDEALYLSHKLNSELIEFYNKECLQFPVIADSAEPARIEEIKRAGIRITPAYKGPNSVNDGIDFLKRRKIFVTKRSVNVIKEIKAYKWKEDKNGTILDEPLKFNDHAMDAVRYAVYKGRKRRKAITN